MDSSLINTPLHGFGSLINEAFNTVHTHIQNIYIDLTLRPFRLNRTQFNYFNQMVFFFVFVLFFKPFSRSDEI